MTCLQDGTIYVGVGPGNEQKIVDTVMGTNPDGPCVTDIKPAFDQVSQDPAFAANQGLGPRGFVLFISDGEQTCGGDNGQIAASVTSLYARGYPSYVVGFGDAVSPVALDLFAEKGGVPRSQSVDGGAARDLGAHFYYQADDAAALDDALDSIVGTVTAEFNVCLGVPCPDGRCYEPGAVCQNGYCLAPSVGGAKDLGAGQVLDAAVKPKPNGGSDTMRAAPGCGCELGGRAPASPLALSVFLLGLAWRFRKS
jgi:hypothetical protein